MTQPNDLLNGLLDRLLATGAPREAAEVALGNIRLWLTGKPFADYRPLLEELLRSGRHSLLVDGFHRVLPFGTGGRRGPVGVGPNRFNPWTLASSIQGHAAYLREAARGGEDPKVVIAYDVRVFRDLREVYPRNVPNPLLGLTSADFALLAARVYAANGVAVEMLDPAAGSYMSTPELSFFIRERGAAGGLNISASHNPPDDNGAKLYMADGAQPVPPEDEALARRVEGVAEARTMPQDEARRAGLIRWIEPRERRAYLDLNLRLSLFPEARGARVVYTPLHGTGATTVEAVLREAGFDVIPVEEQRTPDGTFPACPFRVPNPEVPESMEKASALAKKIGGVDLILSTDPDADRIGALVPDGPGFRFLTGNEIAAIVTHYLLANVARRKPVPKRAVVIRTEVTSAIITAIARRFGAACIDDLLVGFKYIAQAIRSLEERGEYRSADAPEPVRGGGEDFVVGVEESHGILVTPHIRDKDAAGAALLLAELASIEKREGRTLLDYLRRIEGEVGAFVTLQSQIIMRGVEGMRKMGRIMDSLREKPPARIAGLAVLRVRDRWSGSPILSETDRASRNVVALTLEGGRRVIARPSGTEPKIKFYIEVGPPSVRGEPVEPRAQKAEAQRLARAMVDLALEVLGTRIREFAHAISPLVSLEDRIDFDQRFLAELLAEARRSMAAGGEAGKRLAAWADARLKGYGGDPRRLVARAVEAYLASPDFPADARDLAPLIGAAFPT